MEYVLGIDVGSSSTKVGLFSLDGAAVAIAGRAHPTREPRAAYKEQEPELWWRAAVSSIRKVTASVRRERILGIAAAGHISSLTFVDASGAPLRPAVGFQDLRAISEVEEIAGAFSRRELHRHLGIDLPPGATWPLPRLLWFRKNEPGTLDKAHRLLQAKDYVNFRLTGELASDASSNRGIVDLATGKVPHELFSRLGLPESIVPPLFEATGIIGRISKAASRETGLLSGIPVVAGWNDLNACVLGSGAVSQGQAFNITGTSEHIGAIVKRDHRVPELVCAPFLPGRKLLYGVTSCGGGSLEWYRQAFRRKFASLFQEARRAPAGSDGLLFLPYLEGERAPIWDPFASGAFIGIRSGHGEGHFVRAILEGVAFSLRQVLELVDCRATTGSDPLIVSGGAARVALWNRIKADVLQRAISLPKCPQTGVLGAAILAAVATRRYSSCDEAARAMVRFKGRVEPNPDCAGLYGDSFERYRGLYPALQGWFADAANGRSEAFHAHAR
jgi:sugar (pentulose or hexulose) kinase